MLFAIVPVTQLAKYGNSNSYFCDPYKNDITHVGIGTHGALGAWRTPPERAAACTSCCRTAHRCRGALLTPHAHAREQAWTTGFCPCRTRIPRRL